jgi:hypothetical protein
MKNPMKIQVEQLRELLQKHLPQCVVKVDPPTQPKGSWFIDAVLDQHHVNVECRPGKGFGLSAGPGGGFDGPEEVYPDFDSAARRLLELLVFKKATVAPLAVRLRELRRERGVSQDDLARLLHKNQAAVSKFENRGEDVRVRTLKNVVRALGGRLSLHVSFPDGMERELQLEET